MCASETRARADEAANIAALNRWCDRVLNSREPVRVASSPAHKQILSAGPPPPKAVIIGDLIEVWERHNPNPPQPHRD